MLKSGVNARYLAEVMMYTEKERQLVFIDESGDPGFRQSSSRYFGFAIVIFNKHEDAEKTDNIIDEIRKTTLHKSEFKYSKTSENVKDKFFDLIALAKFTAKIIYIDKLQVNSPALRGDAKKFYNYFLKQVLEKANISDAKIKIDGKNDVVKRELLSYIKSQIGKSIHKITYEDSKSNNLIQLADMIVGLACHHCSDHNSDRQRNRINKIKDKIDIWQFK